MIAFRKKKIIRTASSSASQSSISESVWLQSQTSSTALGSNVLAASMSRIDAAQVKQHPNLSKSIPKLEA
jgi:hypothetical protein